MRTLRNDTSSRKVCKDVGSFVARNRVWWWALVINLRIPQKSGKFFFLVSFQKTRLFGVHKLKFNSLIPHQRFKRKNPQF
jgi:hypothetical protein